MFAPIEKILSEKINYILFVWYDYTVYVCYSGHVAHQAIYMHVSDVIKAHKPIKKNYLSTGELDQISAVPTCSREVSRNDQLKVLKLRHPELFQKYLLLFLY